MKPLYIKKNGQVEKVTGAFAMPASYPAERVAYDNTNSGLSADDAQGAIDEIVEEVNDKVDKETGKGLSANDYTTTEKNKLEGISANANKVESSTTNGNIKIDSVETPVYRNYGNNTVLTTDKTPFLTRQTLNPTGFSGYVREKLIGASYAWNQLVQNGDFADGTTKWYGSRGTMAVSSNKCTFTITEKNAGNGIYQGISLVNDHVYFAVATLTPSKSDVGGFYFGALVGTTNITANVKNRISVIAKCTNSAVSFYVYCNRNTSLGVGDTCIYENIHVTDLTLAFGSTIADHLYSLTNNGGITKLRDMGCPIDKYTAYGNGLYSVKTSGKRVLSANLITGLYNGLRYSNGNTYSNATRVSTDGFISLTPNKYKIISKSNISGKTLRIAYHFWSNTTEGSNSQTYDSGWINLSETTELEITSNVIMDGTFSFTDNSSITPSDIEVKLVASVTTYSLGNDELRGKFDLVNGEIVASGDVKESNGGITRVRKRIELNSLTYTKSNSNRFYANISDKADTSSTMGAMMCSNYTYTYNSGFTTNDKCIGDAKDSSYYKTIFIYDLAYASYTTDQFKAAMAGVYLEYDLATPTTEQSTPFADPMSMVGATTEEYIDNRDIPCPVGAERQYMGQSEDVVEIPSSPLSDGKRKLVAETSGGKTQYYFEDDKNGAGTQVNLMTYNTSTNKYVCPSDGYISLSNAGASVGDYIIMSVYGANDNLICGLRCDTPIASMVTGQNLFVKRGMKCYVRATSSTGSFTALFTPLA